MLPCILPALCKENYYILLNQRFPICRSSSVICIILLKVGWSDNIKSLKDIALDQYWMGVIAFVFGAKATQSYFESKMAKVTAPASAAQTTTQPSSTAVQAPAAGIDLDGCGIQALTLTEDEDLPASEGGMI